MTDCACGVDGEQTRCIDGSVYGPCVSEHCGGVCEHVGDCDCGCHQPMCPACEIRHAPPIYYDAG